MKKYLPSKKFIYLIVSFIVVGGIAFLVFNVLFSKNSLVSYINKKNKGEIGVDKLSALKLVAQDTDGDGVPDWKETLWGTDPNKKATFDQVSDLKYIANKSKELNLTPTGDDTNISETDKFAREFFATYVAMKSSGQDVASINNFSSALGQKIASPTIVDQYAQKDIVIDSNTGPGENKKYYTLVKKLFDTYRTSGMGDELSIINIGLAASSKMDGATFTQKLNSIATSYKNFASDLIKIPVPESLASNLLLVVNGSNNTGESIEGMSEISTDPIVGLSGLSQYQKYSNDFINNAQDLETKALK